MDIKECVRVHGAKNIIDRNWAFKLWLEETQTVETLLMRCPSIVSDVLEEFNNDFIDDVVRMSSELGIELDDEFNPIIEEEGEE